MAMNGNTLTTTSADYVIDASHDIILDADGGDIVFKDGGTGIAKFSNNSSDLQISVETADKDIKFNGTDGSSGITALTLDMSAAGAATFNSTVTASGFVGNVTGNVSGTAATVTTAAQSNITSLGTLTALTVDEMTLDGDTLTATDTFTIDAVDDITLNCDNSGRILFGDASVIYGIASNSSSDFVLEVGTNDKDMLFKGQDNGSTITALTLDMSDAGTASFNHNITLPDAGEVQLGADGDLRFFHDGSHNYIKGATSDQDVIIQGNDGGSIINALTLDMSAAGAATFNNKVIATELDISGNADIDGTMEADAYTVNGTALAEFIADTVGAMVSSNTESGITVAYQDADNTLDFTVGTLNQNTSGSAATLTTGRTIGMTGDVVWTSASFNGSGNVTGTSTIQAGAVEHAMLAGDAVDGDNIADDAINSEHYVDGSIDTAHIAADAITGAKIADNAINSEHYTDGSIDTAHIGSGQITAAKMAVNSINSDQYVDGSIDHVHLSADCVDKDNLASLATLLILDSAGSTLRTFHCAGA